MLGLYQQFAREFVEKLSLGYKNIFYFGLRLAVVGVGGFSTRAALSLAHFCDGSPALSLRLSSFLRRSAFGSLASILTVVNWIGSDG